MIIYKVEYYALSQLYDTPPSTYWLHHHNASGEAEKVRDSSYVGAKVMKIKISDAKKGYEKGSEDPIDHQCNKCGSKLMKHRT